MFAPVPAEEVSIFIPPLPPPLGVPPLPPRPPRPEILNIMISLNSENERESKYNVYTTVMESQFFKNRLPPRGVPPRPPPRPPDLGLGQSLDI